ncbi:MAG: hypothetical protein WCF84_05125, partial [Anaerolineae bacterium]
MKFHLNRSWWLSLLAVFVLLLLGFGSAHPVLAGNSFISAPNRVDMVYDVNRDLLYITSGSQVLRYNIGGQQFLDPFQVGGDLKG